MGEGIASGRSAHGRRRAGALCAGLAVAWILLAAWAGPASATEKHAFDPALSLTGGCDTSAQDPVPDPGPCPGSEGDHPPKAFEEPCGVVSDGHGDVYVASPAIGAEAGKEGRIDVFGPEGAFLTEIEDENQPCGLAVDSEGNVFVAEYAVHSAVVFRTKGYPPHKGKEEYEARELIVEGGVFGTIAVDPSNDRVYVSKGNHINEYKSAQEGLGLITEAIGENLKDLEGNPVGVGGGLDVYGANHEIYATGNPVGAPRPGKAFVLNPSGSEVLHEADGKEAPDSAICPHCAEEGFGFGFGSAAVAVDQANGDFYVTDINEKHAVVDQFDAEARFVGQLLKPERLLELPFKRSAGPFDEIAVDDPCLDEPCDLGSYDSPNAGEVYLNQGGNALYAFKPLVPGPPQIREQRAEGITETEAVLRAELDPGGLDTHYAFQYTTQEGFEAHGYEGVAEVPAAPADAGEGSAFEAVSAPLTGLSPGAAYRFRLVASNCEAEEAIPGECQSEGEGNPGGEGEDVAFATYPPGEAGLPDNRGYELVTPPDTGGRVPTMAEIGQTNTDVGFNTTLASPEGESVLFGIEGGSLAGLGGNGFHDTYEALRNPDGTWQSHSNAPSAAQMWEPSPGGFSIAPGGGYSFWRAGLYLEGSLEAGGLHAARYVRRPEGVLNPACSPEPEGAFEFIGCGDLDAEPAAIGRWISPGGDHVIFSTDQGAKKRLEEGAAPSGTAAVYDRTPDGTTHVVSLKPDGGSFGAGEGAEFLGASRDGSAVAFEVGGTIYARLGDAETKVISEAAGAFAGFSEDGRYAFFLTEASEPRHLVEQGRLFRFNTESAATVAVAPGNETTPVNLSADGSHAFFASPLVLSGEEENGQGEKAEAGGENLYAWDGISTRFIATVEPLDVEGEEGNAGQSRVGGLGLWTDSAVAGNVGGQGAGNDPSRSAADGGAFVFESRARLTPYDNTEAAAGDCGDPEATGETCDEVYLYGGDGLLCLSCDQTGVAAASDAQLQSDFPPQFLTVTGAPVNALTPIQNITADGKKVFFQSADRLGLGDTDGKLDVYEWEAQGEGGCGRAGGCVRLISGGHSPGNDFLYAATPSGSDVFFESGDSLLAEDPDNTPSIYDAREGGGPPQREAPPEPCLGEACQPAAVAPNDPTPASSGFEGPGNPPPKASCRRGSRQLRKGRCGRHKHRKQHRPGHNGRRAGR